MYKASFDTHQVTVLIVVSKTLLLSCNVLALFVMELFVWNPRVRNVWDLRVQFRSGWEIRWDIAAFTVSLFLQWLLERGR